MCFGELHEEKNNKDKKNISLSKPFNPKSAKEKKNLIERRQQN